MRKTKQRIWQTNQNKARLRMGFQKLGAGRQSDFWAMVAAHAVNSYCDHW
jgi:hypothetical protein